MKRHVTHQFHFYVFYKLSRPDHHTLKRDATVIQMPVVSWTMQEQEFLKEREK